MPPRPGWRLAAITGVAGSGIAATIPTQLIIDQNGKPKHYASQGLYESGNAPLDLGYVAGRFDPNGLSVSSYLAHAVVGTSATRSGSGFRTRRR